MLGQEPGGKVCGSFPDARIKARIPVGKLRAQPRFTIGDVHRLTLPRACGGWSWQFERTVENQRESNSFAWARRMIRQDEHHSASGSEAQSTAADVERAKGAARRGNAASASTPRRKQ